MAKKITKEDLIKKKASFEKVAAKVEEIPVERFLKDNFLPYAWSFTLNRALSDVSGLKPVQRRILYTMFKRGLGPTAGRQKVATIAGAVLALHPHGDASVAEAIKNLGREHIFRVPLIDGKGDFGAPGSPGAAPRYLEARLNKAAWLNVQEISENAVSMVPSYDDQSVEPNRIPVRWPVSLINGGSGIAVGYASNMPSHNPSEIMRAAQLLLKKPEATDSEILRIVKGPDFNTGGAIVSNDGVKEYLKTGKGTFRIRGSYSVDHLARGKVRIEFHEIPFGTYPEKIIEEIQKGVDKGSFKEIASFKDLSDLRHPTRVVIETRPGVQYQKVLNDLFSGTSLESSFSANMTMIVDNKPVQYGMRELLLDFVEFRKETVRRKMAFQKEKKDARLHVVEGMLKVLLDIDSAVSIIRQSDDAKEATKKLRSKFKITEAQAEYVLSLQLRRLTKMDSLELEKEGESLVAEISEISEILTKDEKLVEFLLEEFAETRKVIGSPRKTEVFEGSLDEFLKTEKKSIRELSKANKKQTCYLTRFATGKVMKSLKPYGYANVRASYRYGPILESIRTDTLAEFVLIREDGTGYKMPMNYLPMDKPVNPKQAGADFQPRELVGVSLVGTGYGLAIGTKLGSVKVSNSDYPNRETFPVIKLDKDDKIINCTWIPKDRKEAYFSMVSKNGMITLFPFDTVRVSGPAAGGVAGMKLRDKDEVVAFNFVTNYRDSVVVSRTIDSIKSTSLREISARGRGGMGVILQSFAKGASDSIVQAFTGVEPIMVIDEGRKNTAVGIPPLTKRAARGSDSTIPVLMGERS